MDIVLFTIHINERELAQPGELAHLGKFANASRIGTSRINMHLSRHSWENWNPLTRELTQLGELAIADRIGKVRTFQENIDTDGRIYADMAFFRRIDDKLALSSRNGTAGRTAKFGRISTARRIGICRDNWHPL